MEARSQEQELELLVQALKLDAGNVDVLLALLRHEPCSGAERIEFLRKLVTHAEARLGPKMFKECVGGFWVFMKRVPICGPANNWPSICEARKAGGSRRGI